MLVILGLSPGDITLCPPVRCPNVWRTLSATAKSGFRDALQVPQLPNEVKPIKRCIPHQALFAPGSSNEAVASSAWQLGMEPAGFDAHGMMLHTHPTAGAPLHVLSEPGTAGFMRLRAAHPIMLHLLGLNAYRRLNLAPATCIPSMHDLGPQAPTDRDSCAGPSWMLGIAAAPQATHVAALQRCEEEQQRAPSRKSQRLTGSQWVNAQAAREPPVT